MRFLRAFLVFASRFSWKQCPEWTAADAKGLQAFMGSHTGRKFRLMVRNEIIVSCERAAMSKGDAFESGVACGWRLLATWLEEYSAQSEESPASTEDEDDLENIDLNKTW